MPSLPEANPRRRSSFVAATALCLSPDPPNQPPASTSPLASPLPSTPLPASCSPSPHRLGLGDIHHPPFPSTHTQRPSAHRPPDLAAAGDRTPTGPGAFPMGRRPPPPPPPGWDGGGVRRLLPRGGSGPRQTDQRPGGRRFLQGLRPPQPVLAQAPADADLDPFIPEFRATQEEARERGLGLQCWLQSWSTHLFCWGPLIRLKGRVNGQ